MPGFPVIPGRPIARVLADDPVLADWIRRHRDEAKATRIARGALPRPLAPHVAAWLPAPDRLELCASTGTVAAALRLRLPAVRSAFEREGWDFREFRVRVQPAPVAPPTGKVVSRQWDRSQTAALSALADGLSEGPLKAAVTGWLRRTGR